MGVAAELPDVRCTVTITSMRYGLTRVKIANREIRIQYIPSAVLDGIVSVYRDEEVFYQGKINSLLTLNAVNGSIIQTGHTIP